MSSFVFNRKKKLIQVWNNMRLSKIMVDYYIPSKGNFTVNVNTMF